jgi:hypothetical protein
MTEISPAQVAPPKRKHSNKRRRNKKAMIVLDDNEFDLVLDLARQAGLSLSAFGRMRMIGTPGENFQRGRPPVDKELLLRILAELGRLNQHAARIARAGASEAPVSFDIEDIGRDYKTLRDLILTAVGTSLKSTIKHRYVQPKQKGAA